MRLEIFIDLFPGWSGSATDLLEKLHGVATSNNNDTRNRYWPKTAARLGRDLKILQKTLRETGIEVTWTHDKTRNKARLLNIVKLPSDPSEESKQACAQKDVSDSKSTDSDKLLDLRKDRPPSYRD